MHTTMTETVDFVIRKAILSDLSLIFDVFKKAVRITAKDFYTDAQINSWADAVNWNADRWNERINKEEFIVATFKGQIIGFACLQGLDYFDLLFVHPDFGRLGVASMLYLYLENKIPKGTTLKTDTSELSLSFFRNQGFIHTEDNEVDMQGVKVINHRMQKLI